MAANFMQVGERRSLAKPGLIGSFVIEGGHGSEVGEVGGRGAELVPEGHWGMACQPHGTSFA